ncbi:ABC transporter substrate-binding protein [Verminephrobacter aporrectodeae]|uniref:Carbohydrate ABC transporter substrate-binding protein n=1 Tax=Verminephrobacter aporrectodeae subsp. tuberculatae TaxID=1110392 RepID=A0ABT3KRW5_9BURK|nr:ABC transporter substrate-binding protein [Verminephrobacter aporrectodeae]MCW5220001.1 carbohydrate ABC transporter substrate-binding protein [Verminephrobacter aporrectodeae subsp. tuberculatae]MCW5289289.1 carbohydrate ABC transporter substrate-binding protein [Verminephrobacter aporrectodeae subsp. tuberculatae]MCW5321041.1 carbohydrate ABC transporter substrate-binding protein [Verminephrobacter aporrectodeae subsp. tuberculatae]MCW8176657.1 carbohydrate ABC transporter substrate-bindin
MPLRSLAATACLLLATWANAQTTTIVSTQMRPVEEAEKVRNVILKGFPDAVNFVPEDGNTFFTRMKAELGAAQGRVSMAIALDGELAPVNQMGGLSDLDDLAKRLAGSREISASIMALGKMGGEHQRFIPLMTNTFQMAANKKALPYLPAGANVNSLSYAQLRDWAKAMKDATGESKLGFPAGPKGLWWRFFQASFYPSHTGGIVRTFRNADAQKAWADFREMWAYVNPRSTSYGFMEEPLKSGEVWVAFDHTARLLSALVERPNDFLVFPAPAGAKGRGFMPVIVGMAVPKNAPDKAAAERVIDYLTRPAAQAAILREVGFFPVARADLSQLSPGVQLASNGMAAVFAAKDGRASLLPVQLGAKGGEFNKIYVDTFTRIVLRKEDIRTVLDEQGKLMDALLKEVGAPCWAPDASSGAQVCSVQ